MTAKVTAEQEVLSLQAEIWEPPEPPTDLVFDDPESLEGWHLDAAQQYQPLIANEHGWLWCESLELWLGTWSGCIRREPPTGTCQWLRFYDRQERLVLLPEEIAKQEQQRAEQLAERLRAAGINPDEE